MKLAGEQNKSAVTDHAISLNHVIDWDQVKVIEALNPTDIVKIPIRYSAKESTLAHRLKDY